MTRCIIIARSSTDRHDVSCKSQILEISQEVKKRGEVIVKTLEFPRKKHGDFLEDPDFKDILFDAKQKDRKWNKIWFYDTSRLSRNRLKAQTMKAFFRKKGIEVEFLKLPKTGEEALDNVIEGILESFDQLLSDFSRAGSIRGQKQNIRSGYRAGGPAPYGYQLKKHTLGLNVDKQPINKSTLQPHPQNFPIVQEYLRRRAAGESRMSILRNFKKRKIKSPSGNSSWQESTCNSIESNLLVYCAHLVYNRHNKKIDGKYIEGKKFRPEAEWEINRDQHKAAISHKDAELISQQIKRRKNKNPKSRKYLLTGILECGVCKGPMVGDSGFYTCSRKRNHISNCSNSNISSQYIDRKALEFVKEILLSKTHFSCIVKEMKKSYKEELAKATRDSSRVKAELKTLDSQKNRLMDLYERGSISADIIEERINQLESKRSDLMSIGEHNNQLSDVLNIAESELESRIIKEYIDKFEDLLDESNQMMMRQYLQNFIIKIQLGRKHSYKKRSRKVNIYGTIPAFARMNLALPRGLEPLLPA